MEQWRPPCERTLCHRVMMSMVFLSCVWHANIDTHTHQQTHVCMHENTKNYNHNHHISWNNMLTKWKITSTKSWAMVALSAIHNTYISKLIWQLLVDFYLTISNIRTRQNKITTHMIVWLVPTQVDSSLVQFLCLTISDCMHHLFLFLSLSLSFHHFIHPR